MGKVNLNLASKEEMTNGLEVVGENVAEELIRFRESHGPFFNFEELKQIPGLNEKMRKSISNQAVLTPYLASYRSKVSELES